jgi:hypothetical protein
LSPAINLKVISTLLILYYIFYNLNKLYKL